MKITLLTIGQTDKGYIQEGINTYDSRLKHYCNFSQVDISINKLNFKEQHTQKSKEAELILKQIKPNDIVVVLDELGTEYTSIKFASFLSQQMNQSTQNLIFIIGGAYGFDQSIYDRANYKIALSKMTFPHQLIRVIFTEQLYRAFTIIRNEQYHH